MGVTVSVSLGPASATDTKPLWVRLPQADVGDVILWGHTEMHMRR